VQSGRVPAAQFLSLLTVCTEEDAYTVWTSLDEGVGDISNVLAYADDAALKKRFTAFVRKVYAPVAAKLGWEATKNEGLFSLVRRSVVSVYY
jgi:hypothetical protein